MWSPRDFGNTVRDISQGRLDVFEETTEEFLDEILSLTDESIPVFRSDDEPEDNQE